MAGNTARAFDECLWLLLTVVREEGRQRGWTEGEMAVFLIAAPPESKFRVDARDPLTPGTPLYNDLVEWFKSWLYEQQQGAGKASGEARIDLTDDEVEVEARRLLSGGKLRHQLAGIIYRKIGKSKRTVQRSLKRLNIN